ncbi:MAG: serine/threonine-protein kinase [Mycobacteriaceae bacterium]
MPQQLGDNFEGYSVLSFIGRGGTSAVYKVHNQDLDRVEALKVLHPQSADTNLQRRFSQEFDIAHSLNHPNVITMYRHGKTTKAFTTTHPGTELLWMTMQYIAGSTGRALIPRQPHHADLPAILVTLRQIAAGLDYAHSMDVLHRDIKPSNILIENLKAKTPTHSFISDFGIAAAIDDAQPLSHNGRIQGSIHYAAPEVLQAQQLSPATDLYSLACMLTEFISGKPPFPLSTTFAITHAHLCSAPAKLSTELPWLPRAIDSILAKALSKDPQQRYRSCSEFAEIVSHTLKDITPADFQKKRSKQPARYHFWHKN